MIRKFKIMLRAVCCIIFSAITAVGLPNSKTAQAADIIINKTNFPDNNFRNVIASLVDTNEDGILSDKECESVKGLALNNGIDDEKISNFKGIEYFKLLESLSCCNNNLTKLDLSQNTMLKELYCSENKLSILNLSQNTMLEKLDCSENNLTKLDLSQNTKLKTASCAINKLSSINISNNPLLEYLDVYWNRLSVLDVSSCIALQELECSSHISSSYHLTQIILNKQHYKKINLLCGFDILDYSNENDRPTLDYYFIPINNVVQYEPEYPDIAGIIDITKPGISQCIIHKYQNKDAVIKKFNITVSYADANKPNITYPSGNFTAPSCTHLFNDYNYTSPVSGSPIVIYGNGGTFKTGTVKTTNRQFTAYTDILASYNYTLNGKGIVKPAAGKVIVGITQSNTKPAVTKNKIIDKEAAKIARAKIKNGQITVTATGKEKGLVYLWIIDTGDKGISECCPVNVQLAPKKLEVQDTSGSKLKTPGLENGNTLDVCVTGFVSSTKTDDCTYTATVEANSQSYITVTPSGNSGNKFTVTATGLKNNKNTKATVIFQCNENGKKIKFTLTVTQ